MNRNRKTVPKGKIVRRFGINIFEQSKYDKVLKRKNKPPGMHADKRKRTKVSDYGKQLIEKQKMKFSYGVSERQLRNIYVEARRIPGVTGTNMLVILERRLDNVVFRLGLASSRPQARQMVSHGHIFLNGRRVTIPSISVKVGDKIHVKNKNSTMLFFRGVIEKNSTRTVPEWLSFSANELTASVERFPEREELPNFSKEQIVVEFYAKK